MEHVTEQGGHKECEAEEAPPGTCNSPDHESTGCLAIRVRALGSLFCNYLDVNWKSSSWLFETCFVFRRRRFHRSIQQMALGKSRFICFNNRIIKRPFPISLPLSHHLSEHQFQPYHLQSITLALILMQTHVENTKNEVTINLKMVGGGGLV